ncbi:MAG TPA: hypothetical protein HA237_06460 [Candidatus Diapherotrites archaeon]|uniref:Uncharacterized protein n=1 Tax=Candidatus Iainarchaeum sp. TaxID=3101447 RepID=A0A7J4ITZ3_9ARCH|nr:hypothetical protein [Candidatus Diapherotrites archaeon]
MNKRTALTVLLVALLPSLAFAADVTVETEFDSINLVQGNEASIFLEFFNSDFEETAFVELFVDTSSGSIEAVAANKKFSINPRESLVFSLTVFAKDDAAEGSYLVELETEFSRGSAYNTVEVRVEELEAIELLPFNQGQEFCIDSYTKTIQVEVANLSSERQRVFLSADSELFLPTFNNTELRLDPNETRTVELEIHLNDSFRAGSYTIPIYALSNDRFVQREVSFSLIKCFDEETGFEEDDETAIKEAFELVLLDESVEVEKGADVPLRFTLTNLLEEEQEIRISSISDLPTKEADLTIRLEENESMQSYINVSARETDEKGIHEVQIFAWNSKGEEFEIAKVNVLPKHLLEVKVLNNEFEQRICSAVDFEVFEIEFENKGDFDERVEVRVENPYESIGVNVSDEVIEVEDGKTETVYITVAPSFDAPLGDKEVELVVKGLSREFTFRQELRFTVVEAFPENNEESNDNGNESGAENEDGSGNLAGGSQQNEGNGKQKPEFAGLAALVSLAGSNAGITLGALFILIFALTIVMLSLLSSGNKERHYWAKLESGEQ